MSTETQPAGNCPVDVTFGPVAEALRLAEYVSQHGCGDTAAVSAELRRLHALRIELQTQLEDLKSERNRARLAGELAASKRWRKLVEQLIACHEDRSCPAMLREAKAEIERLTSALKQANSRAEEFERGWYLRGDALEVAVRQNEHDMLMTGEECRACRAALGA
jgi:DNA repair exonuclease SbcCD ATPase subunit